MNNKVLIVSYYWPPAGGIAVQRWLQFSKHLIEMGYEVTVYTPENPSYPIVDQSLKDRVPEGIQLIRQKIWEPYALAEKISPKNKSYKAGNFDTQNPTLLSKISIFLRGNFFIPDARVFWVRPSVKYLKKYLNQNDIQNIITSGPPHSMHLIGLGLKKENPSLNWLADFRDPWTEISYHKDLQLTSWASKKHLRLEKEVLNTADTVLAASFTDAENYAQKGAQCVSVTNGFETLLPQRETRNNKFTIAYIGKLESQRNPLVFWESLIELMQEHPSFATSISLRMIGNISGSIQTEIENSALGKVSVLMGQLSFSEAQKEMHQADLLMLSNFPTSQSKGIIPGKLFDYIATQNPIVSIGPKEADVQKILKEIQLGAHFTSEEKKEMKDYIYQCFKNWENNKKYVSSLKANAYSREAQAQKLKTILQ